MKSWISIITMFSAATGYSHSVMQDEAENRNDQWSIVWNRKGDKALQESSLLHEANGYDVVGKAQWEAMVRRLLGYAQIGQEGSLAEFGCGAGAVLQLIHQDHPHIQLVGIDYSPSLAKVAKQAVAEATICVQNIAQPIKDPAIASRQFNITLCHGVLMYLNSVEDVQSVLQEMARHTKPGGRILLGDISELEKKGIAENLRKATHQNSKQVAPTMQLDHLYLSRQVFRDFASKIGATIEFIEYTTIDPQAHYPNGVYRFNVLIQLPCKVES